MERVQEVTKGILQSYLTDELENRQQAGDLPTLRLPAPKRYLMGFDEGFTVIATGDHPCVIILPGSSTPKGRIEAGTVVDYVHEMAIVTVLMERDIDLLQRIRSRYAEAIQAVLLRHQKDAEEQFLSYAIKSIRYDRTWRDDSNAPFRSSVWVIAEAYERVKY